MKHVGTIVATLALARGTSFAGCGKIDTPTGTLKAVNTEAKSITVDVDGKDVTLKLTPSSKTEGITDLVGKKVVVTSSHKAVEAVTKG
jgi:hypothetical protein